VARAAGLFEELLASRSKLANRVFLWNTMLKALANAGDYEGALAHTARMRQAALEPSCRTFGKLMEAAAKDGRLQEAEQVWQLFNSGASPSSSSSRSRNSAGADNSEEDFVVKVNTLVDACAKVGNIQRAEYWFDQLGDKADKRTFASLISAYAKWGQVDHATRCLETMHERRVEPDSVCYTLSIFSLPSGACLH
ncbi:unnamed protein product, partial [Polarella glacialis]